MKRLTSHDIRAFDIESKLFGGYDKDIVDDLLDSLAQQTADDQLRIKDLEAQLKNSENKLMAYEEMEHTMTKTVIIAQDTADRVAQQAQDAARDTLTQADNEAKLKLERAVTEAGFIVQNAKNDANDIIRRAHEEESRIRNTIESLKAQGARVHNMLVAAVDSQGEMLNNEALWEPFMRPAHDLEVEETKVLPIIDDKIIDKQDK